MKNLMNVVHSKQLKFIVSIICVSLVFFACNRKCRTGKESILKGQVIDNTTQQGISGALVVVKGQNGDLGLSTKEFGRTTTDANGFFTIDCENFKDYEMEISADKDKYLHLYGSSPIHFDPCDKIKLGLNPSGVIRLHAKNIKHEWDNLAFCDFFVGTVYANGRYADTVFYANYKGNVKGNSNNELKLVYSKLGKDSIANQNIYCPAFDTAFVEFLY